MISRPWHLCSVLLYCSAVVAQQESGTILGTILDPQDSAVAAATVVITNIDNGVAKTTTTTGTGAYAVPFLVPGGRPLFSWFANPGTQVGTTSFGVITTQQNQPRKLQAALKIIF
jgi:Carboxypeptidase regulatory-like domain